MGIAAWLRSLDLEQYEQAFRDNAIDIEVLPELNEADLEKLGVLLGHRKKLLKAITGLSVGTALGTESGTRVQSERAVTSAPATAPSEAERRQLTVMFVDMAGSTALSRRLDPEEMNGLIRSYQNTVAGELARFEGHVAKLMGDGVLCYFGWPQAHEDEAERAVRAGLAVVHAVAALELPDGGSLSARVGIATGLVVVGDLMGGGSAQERAITGETPNLAARLQAAAQAGEVLIAEGTRRLLGELFVLSDRGELALKGYDAAVRAYGVLESRILESRFGALHQTMLTPLVAREQGLSRWSTIGAGREVATGGWSCSPANPASANHA